MKTNVLVVLLALLVLSGVSADAQTPAPIRECPADFDCTGYVGLIYKSGDGPLRDLMRDQSRVQWALKGMVKVWKGKPFHVVVVGSPIAMHVSCNPKRNRFEQCGVSFWGMTGELSTAQSATFEFPRKGRHVGFFTPGRTYDLRPGGSRAFVLSRLKTLQDAK